MKWSSYKIQGEVKWGCESLVIVRLVFQVSYLYGCLSNNNKNKDNKM